jgi:hypothetical protein
MKVFSSPIVACRLPKCAYDSPHNHRNVLSFCASSPDVKANALRGRFEVKSNLAVGCYDLEIDNPLTARIRVCELDASGRYAFFATEVEEFAGKQMPAETGFVKLVCTIVDMGRAEAEEATTVVVERLNYVVRKSSRFEVQAKFFAAEAKAGGKFK